MTQTYEETATNVNALSGQNVVGMLGGAWDVSLLQRTPLESTDRMSSHGDKETPCSCPECFPFFA